MLQPPRDSKTITLSGTSPTVKARAFEELVVASRTGPLEVLKGRDVLVIADAQNLDLGARDLGFKVSWKNLGRTLSAVAKSVARHVALSEPFGCSRRSKYFAARGWQPHVKRSHMVRTRHGMVKSSNADHAFAFATGRLVAVSKESVVVLCSGDGELVEDVAEAIQSFVIGRILVTLSLAGSTAARLDCSTSPLISANIELGLNCLRPRPLARPERCAIPGFVPLHDSDRVRLLNDFIPNTLNEDTNEWTSV